MKRYLVVLAATGAVVAAAATPAFADAGDHNCEGFINSTYTPEVVNHGQEGYRTSTRATDDPGDQAIYVQEYNDPLANCGSTP